MKIQNDFHELLRRADEIAIKKAMNNGLTKQQAKIADILKDIQIVISRHINNIQSDNTTPVYMNIFLENYYSDSMYLEILFPEKNTSYILSILSFVNDEKEEVLSLDMIKRTTYTTESFYTLNDLFERLYEEFI